MQYILTQKEYDNLLNMGKERKQKTIDDLQKLCTMVADHMPIRPSWVKKEEPEPWRCILSVDYQWYCDDCPVKKMCPNKYKNYSK